MTKKVVRNDKGEMVPEHCECGGKVAVFIQGEPIYKCTACGKYYGTMPFPKKGLNESLNKENKNMKKNVIKLNEAQLRKMIAESIKRVLNENENIASRSDTSSWKDSNDAQYQEAIDILSRHALDYLDPEDMIANPDLIENYVDDYWQYDLDDDVLDALYDRFDVAGVIGKNQYGGGRFEALRQLQIDVRDNVLNILQNNNN